MGSTFFLQNLPRHKAIQALARRYRELEPSAVEANLLLLRVASDILNSYEAHLADRGLTQGKFCVLMHLNVEPGAVQPSEIARRIGVTRATVTGLLDGMEKAGLVKRERATDDRRGVAVRLTPKAKALLDSMLPGHYRRVATLMGRLSEKERRALNDLLGKIASEVPKIQEDRS